MRDSSREQSTPLCNLIPRFISEQYTRRRFSGTFRAVSLFVDISGFTRLTETLMKEGKEGAEVISEVLDFYFHPLVRYVYAHGGMITLFAGDAFTALFPTRRKQAVFHATQTACYIKDYFAQHPVTRTKYGAFAVGAKLGVAIGRIQWRILAGHGKHAFYYRGDGLRGCARCERLADTGDIVADEQLVSLVRDVVETEALSPGYFRLTGCSLQLPEKRKRSVRKLAQADLQPFVAGNVRDFSAHGEFRHVCAVFISLDETAPDQRLDAFLLTLLALSSRYGGYLNQIDFGDKGGIALVVFGAPIAHENDLMRAVRFLLALRKLQPPAAHERTDTPQGVDAAADRLRWRAGLTRGTVYAGLRGGMERCEYAVIGDTVNLAARLVMAAGWGAIWTTAGIQAALAGDYAFTAKDPRRFKGKRAKTFVYRLDGETEALAAGLDMSKLVGRSAELTLLRKNIQPLFDGRFAGITCMYGEAGIGKSRLVQELRRIVAAERPVNWFECPCEDILHQSLHPFRHFLKEYFGQSSSLTASENRTRFNEKLDALIGSVDQQPDIRDELTRTRSILAALVDLYWQDSLYAQLAPKLRFENSVYAVKNLVKAESLRKPVLIVIENGQWIDADSQELIQVLTRNMHTYPVAIILVSRYRDDGGKQAIDTAGYGEPGPVCNEIELGYMSQSVVRQYVEQLVGSTVSAALVGFLYGKTNGNPFFVEQLLYDLQERGLLVKEEDALSLDVLSGDDVPTTIQAILIARLDRLVAEVKEVVQTAAVLGREFEVHVLVHMLRGRERLRESIDQVRAEAIWLALSEIRYIFKHALMRDCAYSMQIKARLRGLHRLAAESLEQVHAADVSTQYANLAYHYEQAGITTKACEYYWKAGEKARAEYHNADAIAYYDRFLSYATHPEQRVKAFGRKGAVCKLVGQWAEAEDCYRKALHLAEPLGRPQILADTRVNLADLLRMKGAFDETLRLLEQARSAYGELGAKNGLAHVMSNRAAIYHVHGDYPRAVACLQKQLKLVEAAGDQKQMAAVVNNLGTVQFGQGKYSEALKYYQKGLQTSERVADKRGIGTALTNMGVMHLHQGAYSEAMRCFERMVGICRELGDRRGLGIVLSNMGAVYQDKGDSSKAMDCHRRALRIAQELGDKRSMAFALGNIGNIYSARENNVEAMTYYQAHLEIAESLADKRSMSIGLGNIAMVHISLENFAEAEACAQKMLRLTKELADGHGMAAAKGYLGQVYYNTGRLAESEQIFDKAISSARALGIKPLLSTYLNRKAGICFDTGRIAEAERLNREALELAIDTGNTRNIFPNTLLDARLMALKDKAAGLEALKALGKTAADDHQRASVRYECWRLTASESDRQAALKLFRALAEKTPRPSFLERVKELAGADPNR